MKQTLLLFIIIIFSFSCQENEKAYTKFPQAWELASWRVYGSGGDSGFQTISDSIYTYLFKKD